MLTVNELFSGIGSQSAALERLGVDFKVVGIAEIDKYAIKSYEAIHGPVKNYGDISKIVKLDYADFWTYSFPCQDISVAGKQAGINENTRSGLLYEVERLLYKSIMYGEQPKYLMLENVKNLVGKRFKPQFDEWLKRLDELGYNTYWKVLNAKNYGIPQNRERVFAISIRKDIDTGYEFPIGFDNGKRLKDILETKVDESFYISNEKADKLIFNEKSERESVVKQVGNIVHTGNFENPQRGRIYSKDGCSPALNCCGGGGLEPKILELPCIGASRGRNLENPSDRTSGNEVEQRLEINKNGTSNTITTVQKDNYIIEPNVLSPKRTEYGKAIRKDYEAGKISESRHNMTEMQPRIDGICNTLTTVLKDNYIMEPQFRIRKLTPLECWRLMGFTDEQFHKAEQVNSNSQLYKQAGNSIVVDVLYYLFKNLFDKN